MNRHPFAVGLLCVLLLAAFAPSEVQGTEYKVRAIMDLSGPSVYAPQANQWTHVLQLAAQRVTTQWNNGDNLIVETFDNAASKATAVNRALEATADSSVLAVVTAGLEDDLVEEISMILRFSNVRSNQHHLHFVFDQVQPDRTASKVNGEEVFPILDKQHDHFLRRTSH